MAKRGRTSAYSASDLHKAVEATRANVTITDSLSSDEDAPPATAQATASEKSTAAKRGRRVRGARSSKAAEAGQAPQVAEVTSYIRSTAPAQAEAVTMDDLLPLLNGGSGASATSDQLDEQDELETDGIEGPTSASNPVAPASAVAAAKAAQTARSAGKGSKTRRELATATPMQESPAKRKRGRPSKADIAEREKLTETSIAHASNNVAPATSHESPVPATSSKKRKRMSKVRRGSSPPAVEVRDSLFATQEDGVSAAQDEQANPLFRSPSVESDSPAPPASNPRPNPTKRLPPQEDAEEDTENKSPKKSKRTAKDKGKARAISPEPVIESAPSIDDSDSSSEEAEEEVQKSLVQDLPKRRSAKKQKASVQKDTATAEATTSSSRTRASKVKQATVANKSQGAPSKATASTPVKPASKANTNAVAAATPVASGSGANAHAQNDDNALMPTPSANRPGWIRTRIRKLTIQQHKNFLAHRTRSADRVKGNPWSEDEEITLILALNDMYTAGGALGNQEDITKNQYKRWRYIQEQHGVNGSLSNILAERSNVDLKDKARNIQKYREALGLPMFNWYTYPQAGTASSQ